MTLLITTGGSPESDFSEPRARNALVHGGTLALQGERQRRVAGHQLYCGVHADVLLFNVSVRLPSLRKHQGQ